MKYENKEQIEDKKQDTDKVIAPTPTVSTSIPKHYDIPTVSSKIKERKISEKSRPNSAIPSDKTNIPSTSSAAQKPETKKHLRECHKILEKNKENIPVIKCKDKEAKPNAIDNNDQAPAPKKMCMWKQIFFRCMILIEFFLSGIRSKSAQSKRPLKRNDPVSLYQAYQKDWERFRSQICESSHSDLRWMIRERMLGDKE